MYNTIRPYELPEEFDLISNFIEGKNCNLNKARILTNKLYTLNKLGRFFTHTEVFESDYF
jgi:hypothetical protein